MLVVVHALVLGFGSSAAVRARALGVCVSTGIRLADDSEAAPPGESKAPDAKLAAAIGLSGLAGGATVVSSAATIATAAGGVCAGGACVAGAGALAGASGGAAAAVATGGGLLAGAKAMLVGGTLLATAMVSGITGAPTLDSMVRASTPLNVAIGSGRPTVMEFYGGACPHCRSAAKDLRPVEDAAIRDKGVNWVMINTDDPGMAPVWNMYHVDGIPHFEFFDAAGNEVGFEVGDVGAQTIERRIAQALAHGARSD